MHNLAGKIYVRILRCITYAGNFTKIYTHTRQKFQIMFCEYPVTMWTITES